MFLVAGLTDLFDGLLARTFSRRTSLGAWLDPVADKLLLVTTFAVLTLPGLGLVNRLPVWLTILVVSRDVLIVLTVAVINLAVGRREFRPSIFGKMATATYIVTCVTIMYFNYLQDDLDPRHRGDLRLGRHHARVGLPLRVSHYEDRESEQQPRRTLGPLRHAHLLLEVVDRLHQALLERHLRLPPQERAGTRDVGLAHLRIVGRAAPGRRSCSSSRSSR